MSRARSAWLMQSKDPYRLTIDSDSAGILLDDFR
jgi:hypothetical protein